MTTKVIVEHETVLCATCGIDHGTVLVSKGSERIVRCKKCGLVYVSPRILPDIARVRYQADYFSNRSGVSGGYEGYLDHMPVKARSFHSVLDSIEKLKEKGRLLEVGCAYGHFLDAAKGRGWRVAGVEVSEEVARQSREDFGLDIMTGDFLELDTASLGLFDVVVMLDCLEHLQDPRKALDKVSDILAPEGLAVLLTPNHDGIFRKILRSSWPHYTPREHFYYFTPKTLGRLLEGAGFHLLEVKDFRKYTTLAYLMGALGGSDGFARDLTKALSKVLSPFSHKAFRLNMDEMLILAQVGAH